VVAKKTSKPSKPAKPAAPAKPTKPVYNDWPDGKPHSLPYAQYLIQQRNNAGNPLSLPAPPVGTYDPAVDYNADAADRGFGQFRNDAATAYEQGQQDYGLGLGDLTTGRDRTLADLLTNETRLNQDYGTQTQDLGHQYGILGHQQAQSAAQHGVTSQGLLAQSLANRTANQQHDQAAIDTAHNRGLADISSLRGRTGEDFTAAKTRLDLANARQFGGYGDNIILNPLTGQPEAGSLLTQLTRAGAENTAYQAAAGGLRASQAAAGGYISPLTQAPADRNLGYIGLTPLTPQMVQNGLKADTNVLRTGTDIYGQIIRGNKKTKKGNTVTYTNKIGGGP
jgi:hypothetical protein